MPSDSDDHRQPRRRSAAAVPRRRFLTAAAAFAALPALPRPAKSLSAPADPASPQQWQPLPTGPVSRIAFGACADQTKPQPIWDTIVERRPELFLMIGDNIYADTENMVVMRAKYAQLAAKPGFRRLRATTPVLATWDDHDYGLDDGGAEYRQRDASRQTFLDFFGAPPDSPRRTQPGGLYTANTFGPPGRRLQIIMLDTRYDRGPLVKPGSPAAFISRVARNRGPYVPHPPGEAVRILGEDQWSWLADRLAEPADLRLVVSSIQVLTTPTGWEAWANMPAERERLLALVAEAGNVVFISGDIHGAEISRVDDAAPYPLWELTSSGLTESWPFAGANENRVSRPWRRRNFGWLEIDWQAATVTLEAVNLAGNPVMAEVLPLAALT